MHRSERRSQTSRTIRETEAEAVAFVVSHAIGLDGAETSTSYIQLLEWRQTDTHGIAAVHFKASQILTTISPGD